MGIARTVREALFAVCPASRIATQTSIIDEGFQTMSLISNSTNNAETSSNNSASSFKSDLQFNVVSIIKRRFPLLVVSAILGVACGVAYIMVSPVTYESESQVLLMQNDSGAMVSSVNKGDNSISEDLLATHMSLIQSSRIVQSALARTTSLPNPVTPVTPVYDSEDSALVKPVSLDMNQEPAGELRSASKAQPQSEPLQLANLPSIVEQLKPNQSAADFVINNLYVTRGGSGQARTARILTLAFRHNSPDDAKRVVEAIVNEYSNYVQSKFKDINQEAVDLIQKARKELQSSIDDQYTEYREFRNNSPLLSANKTSGNIHSMRYEELSAELSKLNLQIDEQQGRLEMVTERLKDLQTSGAMDLEKLALIDIQNAERLGIIVTVERGEAQTASFQAMQPERMAGAQAEYSSVLQLKAKLGQALKEFGNQHPTVLNLESQIKEMEQFIDRRDSQLGVRKGGDRELTPDDVMKAYVRLLDSDLAALTRRREDLLKEIGNAEEMAKSLIEFELREEELARGLKRQEDLYDSVVERLRDINMQQESSNLILEIIQEPDVGRKVSPSVPIGGVVAIMSTLLLAGLSVLVAELSDKRIHSAEELEQILETRVLAHVVDFQRDPESRKALKLAKKANSDIAPDVLTWHDPKHRVNEVYRTIRTEMMFHHASGQTVFGVTSPSQGDGKSTTSANLAVSLAKAGKSVLLLDADMRRPSIHKLFKCSSESGLADYLANKSELKDILNPSGADNLSVIRAGHNSDDAAELLASSRFAELIKLLKQQYDYVLVDCPPLLPVSDPAIIAPLMDGILMVATTQNLGTQELKQCKRILDSKQAVLCGVIVNRTRDSNSGYEYTGYINSAYGADSGTRA